MATDEYYQEQLKMQDETVERLEGALRFALVTVISIAQQGKQSPLTLEQTIEYCGSTVRILLSKHYKQAEEMEQRAADALKGTKNGEKLAKNRATLFNRVDDVVRSVKDGDHSNCPCEKFIQMINDDFTEAVKEQFGDHPKA